MLNEFVKLYSYYQILRKMCLYMLHQSQSYKLSSVYIRQKKYVKFTMVASGVNIDRSYYQQQNKHNHVKKIINPGEILHEHPSKKLEY